MSLHPARLCAILGAAALLAFLASFAIGYVDIPVPRLLRGFFFGSAHDDIAIIAREIRLPRAALGLVVGATLGLGGAALQGLFRNPLAEPGIVGVSTSAGLGAVIVFYFGLARAFPSALPLAAMAGALFTTLLLFAIGRRAGTLGLILAGVALNSLMTALTMLAMSLSPNPYALSEIVYWLMGSLKDKSLTDLSFAAPLSALGAVLILSAGRGLDALTLGEEAAASLGISLRMLRLRIIAGVALSVGACVAAAGSIGFVGLIVPHLLRPFVGHRPGALLVPSALGGALLLTVADIGVRLAAGRTELGLGVVTAFIGAPFFFWLVARAPGGLGR
jgi:iron complex transport system permease protein